MPRDESVRVPATGSPRSSETARLNIVMVGFFAGVTELVSFEAIKSAVKSSVPKGTEDLNMRALKRGYDYGRELAGAAAT